MISFNEVEKYIDNSYVILDLKASNKDEAISEMLIYSESKGLRINIAQTIESMYKKEDIISSGLGYGVAFPHVRTNEVEDNDIILFGDIVFYKVDANETFSYKNIIDPTTSNLRYVNYIMFNIDNHIKKNANKIKKIETTQNRNRRITDSK